ncbi:MAG TPA: alpha-glucan family phosphorylase, partial [Candidatus Dormibacteraeota bacterium]|nr:alpha-glucan family phosphorylase [Candidatus Dormibacteraeota bacterium]
PVALLRTTPRAVLERAAEDTYLVERAREAVEAQRADLSRSAATLGDGSPGPVAFVCAEYGVHVSLPVYSGGLGVLAGDILKEASDRALPVVAVGLMYREGYFRQRLDRDGWQRESWPLVDPADLPAVAVRDGVGRPVLVTVPLRDNELVVRVWRVNVGRVPLYLLDTDCDANHLVDRWISSRLYVGDRRTRLDQYAVLGAGAVRVLAALGISATTLHLNEGHAALAPLELAAGLARSGVAAHEALERVRRMTVFTTHTPVAAGNEVIPDADLLGLVPALAQRLSVGTDQLLALGHVDGTAGFGLSPLGIRMSRSTNAVSRRHGEVAREMWRRMFPDVAADEVPIRYVTNGVHVPTWMAPEMRALLDRALGAGWQQRTQDPATWAPVGRIPDAELWEVRTTLRRRLVSEVRRRVVVERLRRGESREYAEQVVTAFDDDTLTVGFARRIATYKRLGLIVADALRGAALLRGARRMQVVIAGKAHPSDDEGKRILRNLFEVKRMLGSAGGIVVLEDYDLELASLLVSGCDVWVNLPQPPMEASGTSGMKAALNGCLNLSILDGWWCEGYHASNGWAIEGAGGAEVIGGAEHANAVDAGELYRLFEEEVLPEFWGRDESNPPHAWLDRVRRSLQSLGPLVTATRMVETYASEIWPAGAGALLRGEA